MTTLLTSCTGRSLVAGALLAVVCLAGCGDSGPRLYPLSGEVTYRGQPVKAGTIRFEPAGGTIDPRASPEVLILDGRYDLPRSKGVAGGPYTVYILAGDGNTQGELAYGNVLFPPYYVTKVDLPPEGGKHDFHIPPQKKK